MLILKKLYLFFKRLIRYIDDEKIRKILWNLLSNAVKFTRSGGFIILSAVQQTVDDKNVIKFEVSDSGIGISEKDRKHIFDRFFKVPLSDNLQTIGSGIGLSIVKELVALHRGKIEVNSVLGKGTTFTIFIPTGRESYADTEIHELIHLFDK